MKPEKSLAIVLRRTNYGEADRIIQFLTENGREAVMARGVRKEKSKLAGGVELFAINEVVIGKGKGRLGVLTSARMRQFFYHILEDYDRLEFGYEVLKLVQKASEMIDEPEWFDITKQCLEALNQASNLALIKSWFYLHYSEMLGHGLGLYYDRFGKKFNENENYAYDEAEKALYPTQKGELTSSHITLLRLMASKPLTTLSKIGGIEGVIDECLFVARRHAAVEGEKPW